ncbi:MAG: DNA translocase FtsK [Candidatus Omnitrophota bacterium]
MDQTRKNEIVAVALFAISLFLFLSIFTSTGQDLSFYTSSPNPSPRNVTGIIGVYVGGVLMFFIGRAAYVIPLVLLIWGVSRLSQLETRKMSFKLFGTAVLVTAVSASLSMIGDTARTAAFSRGGVVGFKVSGFLLEYLGRIGGTVFISAMVLLSMLVATEFLILPIMIALNRAIARFFTRGKDSIGAKAGELISNIWENRDRFKAGRADVARKLEAMKKQADEVRRTALARKVKETAAAEGHGVSSAGRSEPRIVIAEKTRKMQMQPARVTGLSDSETGEKINYKLPGIDMLKTPLKSDTKEREDVLKQRAATLERTLLEFGVEAKVVKINRGPVITMYELEPAVGTKVNKITSLSDNISLAMRSSNIRIVAPLPGKGTIGIEVPNSKSELVLLRDILETPEYIEEESPLKFALGKDISGKPIVTDLAKMPHLLIAGATGSGKTVCLNGVISSFLFNASPDELKFLMVDPKRVELMMFEGIPHLVSPIVTNPKKAAAALNWVIGEMERRYEVFAAKGVRNIASYKERREKNEEDLPYIVVIVDELADLMIVAQQDVEVAIMRIAQLARAAGIHLILATQRPSVNVITGVIKANFSARISFKVASKVDSRTVLDANGAEKLLGRGDMLFMEPGESSLIRGQCSMVSDGEIREMVKYIKSQAGPQYVDDVVKTQETRPGPVQQEKDDLYREAVRMVLETRQASVSMIQRKLRVGYSRAARMVDIMEEEGVVGPYNGSRPREILIENLEMIKE